MSMRAVVIEQMQGGSRLTHTDIPRPVAGVAEVVIEVKASSVNRADLAVREGTHGLVPDPSDVWVAGMDAAGVVIEAGEAVTRFQLGDRVMSMVQGGLAERVAVHESLPLKIPNAWSFVEGAAAVVGLLTEHNALATAGRLVADETVLIHGATSAVALQAVQLASFLGAGRVLATVRSDRADGLLTSLGADHVLHVEDGLFADQIANILGPDCVDVIIDHVGGPYLTDSLRVASHGARIVSVGRVGGRHGTLDLEELARKRVELVGVTFRTRSLAQKAAVVAAVEKLDLRTNASRMRPVIDRVWTWASAEEAQLAVRNGEVLGKLVLDVSGDMS